MTELAEKKRRPKRSWLSFSMRAMLVLVTLLCAVLGWLGRELYQARIESEVAAKVEAVGGRVVYDYQLAEFVESRRIGSSGYGSAYSTTNSAQPPWLDRQLGFPVQARIVRINFDGVPTPGRNLHEQIGPEGVPTKLIVELRKLPQLERFDYRLRTLSDKSFEHLSQIPSLEQIHLSCSIKPENLRVLAKAKKLEIVQLDVPLCTDDHFAELVHFPALKQIDCNGNYVTGQGIASLGQCTQLESLQLSKLRKTTDEDLLPLAQLKSLRKFRADQCRITARSYPTFAQLPNLELFQINMNRSYSPPKEALSHFASLAEMQAEYERGPDSQNQLPRLQSLYDATTDKPSSP